MSDIKPSNIPSNLDIDSLCGKLNAMGGPAKNCRFAVRISPTGQIASGVTSGGMLNDLIYLCETTEFPGRGFNTTEIRYWGPSQVMPNNVLYGAGINMSFICRNDSTERAFFDNWQDVINPVNNFMFEYPDNYYADIQIFQLSEVGQLSGGDGRQLASQVATYGWTLRKSWPTLVNPQQVTWADQDILRLQVSFAYKYWDRPNLQTS